MLASCIECVIPPCECAIYVVVKKAASKPEELPVQVAHDDVLQHLPPLVQHFE